MSAYRNSRSLSNITKALAETGYRYRIGVYQASQFGASANRRRLLLVAVRDGGEITPVTPFLVKSKGWYSKVKGMISKLPEIELAPSIAEKLIEKGIDPKNPGDYLFINGKIQFKHLSFAFADKPAPTFVASANQYRIIEPNGTVRKATPRVVAKLMGLDSSFKLPKNEELAYRILGNGVSGELTSSIITPMITKNILNVDTVAKLDD